MNKSKNVNISVRAIWKFLLTIAVLLAVVIFFTDICKARMTYIITDEEEVTVVESSSNDVEEVISDAGIILSEFDSYVTNQRDESSYEVSIIRYHVIYFYYDDVQISILTQCSSVSEFFDSRGIDMDEVETMNCALEQDLYDGMRICVKFVVVAEEETETEELEEGIEEIVEEVETEKEETAEEAAEESESAASTSAESQSASSSSSSSETSASTSSSSSSSGTTSSSTSSSSSSTETTAADDEEEAEEEAEEEETEDTDEDTSGTVTLSDGTVLTYSSVLTVKATAYTTENSTNKITATGTTARVGAVSVDPSVIPYGTELYIVASDGSWVYGYAVAEDCGSFSGNRVDLFFDTYDECIAFGVQTAIVYILS